MEENEISSLESVFNQSPAAPANAELTAAPEPQDAGVTASPPEARPHDPSAGFQAAALDERRKRQDLEREFEAYKKQYAPTPPTPAPAPAAKDFTSQEDYLAALAEERAQKAIDAAFERREQQQRAATEQQQDQADIAEMFKVGKAKYPDFEHVVTNGDVPITATMKYALLARDDGHDVSYHLAKNPHEAARIARLPASSQAREIGVLAKTLATPAAAPAPLELPKTLTQTRSASGQFTSQTWTGPTPLDSIARRK